MTCTTRLGLVCFSELWKTCTAVPLRRYRSIISKWSETEIGRMSTRLNEALAAVQRRLRITQVVVRLIANVRLTFLTHELLLRNVQQSLLLQHMQMNGNLTNGYRPERTRKWVTNHDHSKIGKHEWARIYEVRTRDVRVSRWFYEELLPMSVAILAQLFDIGITSQCMYATVERFRRLGREIDNFLIDK